MIVKTERLKRLSHRVLLCSNLYSAQNPLDDDFSKGREKQCDISALCDYSYFLSSRFVPILL